MLLAFETRREAGWSGAGGVRLLTCMYHMVFMGLRAGLGDRGMGKAASSKWLEQTGVSVATGVMCAVVENSQGVLLQKTLQKMSCEQSWRFQCVASAQL